MRIAVLSDVHGNLTAFDAVLADIDARGITTILNLGDVAGKGPRGSAAIARTRERCALTVRGNWDDFLPVSAEHEDPSIRWWHDELTADDRDWLKNITAAGGARMRRHGKTIELTDPHVMPKAEAAPAVNGMARPLFARLPFEQAVLLKRAD